MDAAAWCEGATTRHQVGPDWWELQLGSDGPVVEIRRQSRLHSALHLQTADAEHRREDSIAEGRFRSRREAVRNIGERERCCAGALARLTAQVPPNANID